jgi:hypothetical protein
MARVDPKDFMGNHEWCFRGWKEGAAHYFNPEITNATDVWSVRSLAALDGASDEKPAACRAGDALQLERDETCSTCLGIGLDPDRSERMGRGLPDEIDPLLRCDRDPLPGFHWSESGGMAGET